MWGEGRSVYLVHRFLTIFGEAAAPEVFRRDYPRHEQVLLRKLFDFSLLFFILPWVLFVVRFSFCAFANYVFWRSGCFKSIPTRSTTGKCCFMLDGTVLLFVSRFCFGIHLSFSMFFNLLQPLCANSRSGCFRIFLTGSANTRTSIASCWTTLLLYFSLLIFVSVFIFHFRCCFHFLVTAFAISGRSGCFRSILTRSAKTRVTKILLHVGRHCCLTFRY